MEKRNKALNRRKPKAAATPDVLGSASRPVRIDPKWEKHYRRLTELRENLVNRLSDLSRDAISEQPSFSMHMADAGTDTYDRDLALGMLSSEQDAIYEVEEALDRITYGTYGICELTGKPIEAARLAAVPWTRFSSGG